MAKRKSYSKEFKREALEKLQSSGKSAAELEREMEISQGSLSRWKRELGADFDTGKSPEQGDEQAQEPDTVAVPGESAAADEEIEESELADSDDVEVMEKDPETKQVVEAPPTAPDSEDTTDESEDVAVTGLEDKTSLPHPSPAKRIAGIAAIIFGGLGVILSIAAIIAVWG